MCINMMVHYKYSISVLLYVLSPLCARKALAVKNYLDL